MNPNLRILVVDDEEIVRRGYVRIFSGMHCTVDTARNGIEALQRMDEHPSDVVLVDLRMPEMDGMSLLRAVKAKWPECEVIVVTGYPELESAKESVALGAYDYLAKPVGPDEIIDVTHGAIMHKRWAMRRLPQDRAA